MLSRMQAKYVGKPVRFLLFPCNQFAAQEPAANGVVKAFAQQFVTLGPGSNVIMFAKSNLNNVTCTYAGADACMAESKECCPMNDAVYQYLLSETAGTIKWNFDKIVTGTDGRPYAGEKIFHGPALDDDLSAVIDTLLAKDQELGANAVAFGLEDGVGSASFIGAFLCIAGLAAWRVAAVMSAMSARDNTVGYLLLA
mmetsp:Transcript_42721/g.117931  ORF Transcript_42721/g.117931 Transcript_42721/m.117931 type:complete len:197 (-) Transcript_42721:85-675(-)